MKDCEKEKNEKGRERRERYKAKFLIEIFTHNISFVFRNSIFMRTYRILNGSYG